MICQLWRWGRAEGEGATSYLSDGVLGMMATWPLRLPHVNLSHDMGPEVKKNPPAIDTRLLPEMLL